jgi:hypothetical protein
MNAKWIKKQTDVEIRGFKTYSKVAPVTDYLSKVNYLSKDIADLDYIRGESKDHWVTKCLIAGELMLAGCTDVVINTHGDQGGEYDPDVTCLTPSGERLGMEYARPKSRSKKQLEEQRENHLKYCQIWRCVCQSTNETQVRKACGDFTLPRGEAVGNFIKNLAIPGDELDIKLELEKLRREDLKEENQSADKSSFAPEMNEMVRTSLLEDGEDSAENGTI